MSFTPRSGNNEPGRDAEGVPNPNSRDGWGRSREADGSYRGAGTQDVGPSPIERSVSDSSSGLVHVSKVTGGHGGHQLSFNEAVIPSKLFAFRTSTTVDRGIDRFSNFSLSRPVAFGTDSFDREGEAFGDSATSPLHEAGGGERDSFRRTSESEDRRKQAFKPGFQRVMARWLGYTAFNDSMTRSTPQGEQRGDFRKPIPGSLEMNLVGDLLSYTERTLRKELPDPYLCPYPDKHRFSFAEEVSEDSAEYGGSVILRAVMTRVTADSDGVSQVELRGLVDARNADGDFLTAFVFGDVVDWRVCSEEVGVALLAISASYVRGEDGVMRLVEPRLAPVYSEGAFFAEEADLQRLILELEEFSSPNGGVYLKSLLFAGACKGFGVPQMASDQEFLDDCVFTRIGDNFEASRSSMERDPRAVSYDPPPRVSYRAFHPTRGSTYILLEFDPRSGMPVYDGGSEVAPQRFGIDVDA